MPTHEREQRRRLSSPVARAAPPASPRPFPQPDPSPQSPSSVTSLHFVVVGYQYAYSHVHTEAGLRRSVIKLPGTEHTEKPLAGGKTGNDATEPVAQTPYE